MECKEILINWLNNAYGMEMSLIETMKEHWEDAEDMPELQEKLQNHIDETKRQAEKVKNEIMRLGGDVSGTKTMLSEMLGKMTGVTNEFANDKVVKNVIAEHASEHFEMAIYMAIAQAAKICGEKETANLAMEIMNQEKTTGEELERFVRMAVQDYIDRETANE